MQKNTEKIKSAFDETLIDNFTLQSSAGYKPVIVASGRVKSCDKNFIYIQIGEEDIELTRNYCEKQYFDIIFNINRTSYQLQHRALNYVERHHLHPILINNERYNSYEDVDRDELVDHPLISFTGKLAENLNTEQKIAVKYISKSNSLLPYILFGPAGK